MNIIFSNYGNDSIALIQWAYENNLPDVTVAHVITGWQGTHWQHRLDQGQELAKRLGFNVTHLTAHHDFSSLIQERRAFPTTKFQWCAGILKGLPLLEWLDEEDFDCKATILIAHRRAASPANQQLPEYIEESEYYGDRRLWHPLYLCTTKERDALIQRSGLDKLSHRALECDPCVNSDEADLLRLDAATITRTRQLEHAINQSMFSSQRFANATNLTEVILWLKQEYPSNPQANPEQFLEMGCGSPYGCGL
ncbi:Phosphoadenosine phosphosulfate reductase family protein [Piscirickettsia salmonis]|uniref:phosphoadenosine phosphosulfate reductase family protein n=1 Tax=Piscirickettsia salmonis TaxID=1238 RepID=UPI0012BA6884|nr:phosphoadenosine phosphosulfate reductase family protein [Piscirickettsia salmonis]QGP55791.1 Phosphoadenosine phosphosulfate reductase family protein [Piscirickettsia salmonis]QGP58340.1 Phosphoadenosine phosphosulfate reductase family protein [Piscirickettsia salmonis]QGP65361.1 Phosphoadenosine phosphosulfate reductase family protein [Piscirickettsia salmonis]